MLEPLAIAVIAIVSFWVGLMVGVRLDEWWGQSGGDQDED